MSHGCRSTCCRQDIHAELDIHSSLLTEIDSGVDKTNTTLKTQTKKVEAIAEQTGGCLAGCCGLFIIFFLLLVIVMLIFTSWACALVGPWAKHNC